MALQRRFIVYQYGKVGSTSLTTTLNTLPSTEAYQTHFLGRAAFQEIFDRLLDPGSQDYFFEHAAGQLAENLKIYRHFQRRESDSIPVNIVSVSREPFSWFQSALLQDGVEHVEMFRNLLQRRGCVDCAEDEVIGKGLSLVMRFIEDSIRHFGTLDLMRDANRYPEIEANIEHLGAEDFRVLMYFLNIFMRPHVWFRNHFAKVLEFGLEDLEAMEGGARVRHHAAGNTYLLRYETIEASFAAMLTDIGYENAHVLHRENLSQSKPYAVEFSAAFETAAADSLRQLCHSSDTRLLGYSPT